jgi:hypothetical protein
MDGELSRVADVTHEFTFTDLYDLAMKIAGKRNISKVSFVHRSDIVNVK